MRLVVALVVVLSLGAAFVPNAAAYYDSISTATEAGDPAVQQVRPVCALLLDQMRAVGAVGDHSAQRHHGYEEEWLAHAPECRDLRDELQHEYNVYGALGNVETCNFSYGVTCAGTNMEQCDFAIMVRSGLVYYCIGGLNPEN